MAATQRVSLTMVALLLALAPPVAAFQPWTFDAEAGAGYDSNPRNASQGEDEAQSSIRAGVGGGYETRFTPFTALQLRGTLAGEHNQDYSQLSNGRFDTRVRLLFKPGASFYTPLLAVWVSGGGRDYGSGIRDSYDYRGGLYLIEPVTTQIAVRIEAQASKRDSASRVFDLEESAFGLTLDWTLGSWLATYLGYRYADGDIVVSARGLDVAPKAYHHLYLENPGDAIEYDDGYENEDFLAYRLAATTQTVTVGFNVPLTPELAMDVQAQAHDTELDSGYSYDRWLAAMTLLLRF